MPRKYKKISNRGVGVSQDKMDMAILKILDENRSVMSVSKEFGIPKSTLFDYYKKLKNPNMSQPPKVGYQSGNRVFSEKNEKELADYIIRASEIYLGLTPHDVRKLAFQVAKLKSYNYPSNWTENEVAGIEWYYGFMKRNPILSLRKAQATSLSRATSFNKANVKVFFDNLQKIIEKEGFEPRSIYNVDETGITTVHHPTSIVARKGAHQVGALTSGERGTLLTVAIAVNATGNSIPPHFVFPRIRFKDHFIMEAPVGSIGSGNATGWMKEGDFSLYIRHFAKHSGASKENKVLLLMDNHESHISVEVIDFCRDNGISLLTFPPHCSHKLQPLDRSIYGPLKRNFNKFASVWMKQNPGKTMTIYNLPGLVKDALIPALSISNITSGFRCTGISPFNPNIFTDADFSPSFVTDRPEFDESPSTEVSSTRISSVTMTRPLSVSVQAPAVVESHWDFMLPIENQEDQNVDQNLDLEKNFPFNKAGPRKTTNKGRKRRKSAILTDSPERNAIEKEKQDKKAKIPKRKMKQPQDINNETPKKKPMKQIPRKIKN